MCLSMRRCLNRPTARQNRSNCRNPLLQGIRNRRGLNVRTPADSPEPEFLLVPQRLNRVQQRGLVGRIETEEDPYKP